MQEQVDMATYSNRLVAVNTDPAMLDSLRSLEGDLGIDIVAVGADDVLLTSLVEDARFVALGLRADGIVPTAALRRIAAATSRPPVVLIGNMDAVLVQSVRDVAKEFGLETVAHAC